MSWADAAVAAAAALGASSITAAVSLRQSKKSLESNSGDLRVSLAHQTQDAREYRDQERLRDAYTRILKHVFWCRSVNAVRSTVASRRLTSVEALRADNPGWSSTPLSEAEVDAFRASGPTDGERKVIEAGPALEDTFRTQAIVTAFASTPMLEAFSRLSALQESITGFVERIESALMRERKTSEHAGSDARQVVAVAGDMVDASSMVREAVRKFNDVVMEIERLARDELRLGIPDRKPTD